VLDAVGRNFRYLCTDRNIASYINAAPESAKTKSTPGRRRRPPMQYHQFPVEL